MRIAPLGTQLIAALTLAAIASVQAQTPGTSPDSIAKVGEHVRVLLSRSDSIYVSGRFRGFHGDSLWIAPDSSDWTEAFGRDDVARFEIQHDEKTREYATTVMMTLGAVGGVALAVSYCLHNSAQCAADQQAAREAQCRGEDYATTASLIFSATTLVGGLLGYALAPAPHWDVVILPVQSTGSDGQLHMGINLGFRYSFGRRKR